VTRASHTTVFLIGFMGSGKSTVGPLLARRLGLPFVDTDSRVAARAGRSVERIFAEDGEAAFRALESAVLDELDGPAVAAVGGGAPAVERNWAALERGVTVYLDVPPDELVRRLEGAPRPLLDGLSPNARADRIKQLLSARAPCYRRARWTVRAAGAPADVAEEIFKRVVGRCS